jgi:hypothetical protein
VASSVTTVSSKALAVAGSLSIEPVQQAQKPTVSQVLTKYVPEPEIIDFDGEVLAKARNVLKYKSNNKTSGPEVQQLLRYSSNV